MSSAILKVMSSAAFLAVVFTVTTRAQQDQWSWPEKPKNLQVLPKDGLSVEPGDAGIHQSAWCALFILPYRGGR
jgi:hypothetical protein